MSISRMIVFFVVINLTRMLDTNNPIISWGLKLIFLIVCGITYLFYTKIKTMVNEKNDHREIWIKKKTGFTSTESVKTTYFDYENEICDMKLQQIQSNAMMMTIMSVLMGMIIPLVMQIINMPLDLFDSPLFKKYILNKELERPYKEEFNRPDDSLNNDEIKQKIKERIVEVWDCKQTGDFQGLTNLVLKCTEKNVQCDAKDCKGWSALMVLAGSPSCPTQFGEQIIKSGKCSLYLQDNDGWTALHWAAYHSNCGFIDSILESVDDKQKLLDIKDNNGKTALDIAKEKNMQQVLDTFKIVLEW